jgi:hypothetical protein
MVRVQALAAFARAYIVNRLFFCFLYAHASLPSANERGLAVARVGAPINKHEINLGEGIRNTTNNSRVVTLVYIAIQRED